MAKGGLLVKKFGGTSVGTAERIQGVADIISNAIKSHRVVVVLSAMSGETKKMGTTSRLLQAAEEVLKGNTREYHEIMEQIKSSHLQAILSSVHDEGIRREVMAEVEAECDRLTSFLEAAEVIGEISCRSRDVIIGTGEKLSCRIFAAVLQSRGVRAAYVNLERIVQRNFSVHQLDHTFYAYLKERLVELLDEHVKAGEVPIVTGYFGFVPGGILDAVGRGYTDFTASLIAAALKAEEFQIWKEVDGIFSADPRKVPSARVLPSITPAEAAELTFYGAEVIHPFTMEQAINAKIPIRIKNTFNPSGTGTLIDPCEGAPSRESKHPTAVTVKNNVTLINVASNRKSLAHGFMKSIFSSLDRHGIAVDLISTSEVNVSLAVSLNEKGQSNLPLILKELEVIGTVTVTSDLAIVSLVGQEMKCLVGIAGRMFSALAAANVNIEVISQGASEINISCVISSSSADRAIQSIHHNLISVEVSSK